MEQNTRLSQLYTEFVRILTEGREEDARKFLTGHFAEFPQEIQGGILRGFLAEGLERGLETQETIGAFREDAAAILQRMEQLTRKLEDKKRVAELEEKMNP